MRRRTTTWGAIAAAAVAAVTLAACAHLLGYQDVERSFEHRTHVLEGISCATCHSGMEAAGERSALHIPGPADCLSCHEDLEDPSRCQGECLNCHGAPGTAARVANNRTYLKFSHQAHLDRNPGQCVRCHTGVANREESLAAPMAVCFTCHPHEDQFAVKDCGGCHLDLSNEGSMPSQHAVHDLNFKRRHGVQAASGAEMCATCHTERSCAKCHGVTTPALPATIRFDAPGTSRLHRAGFFSRHANEAQTQPGLCGTCHAERFCRDCHTQEGVAAGASGAFDPHPAGWIQRHGPQARRDPAACASCHGGQGEQLCVGCHRVGGAGGSIHPPGWTSRLEPTATPCRPCHAP